MKCQRCGKEGATRYHRNTAYHEEESNYAVCCKECQDLDHDEMQELWDEYYRGRL